MAARPLKAAAAPMECCQKLPCVKPGSHGQAAYEVASAANRPKARISRLSHEVRRPIIERKANCGRPRCSTAAAMPMTRRKNAARERIIVVLVAGLLFPACQIRA